MYLRGVLATLSLLPAILSAPLDSAQSPLLIPEQELGYRIPTRYESTVLGRRLLALSSLGVASTIFPPGPADDPSEPGHGNYDDNAAPPLPENWSANPRSTSNLAIALPEYLSDCETPSEGNPTLLLLNPSTTSRNLRAQRPGHQNLSLSISWWDQKQQQQHQKQQQIQQIGTTTPPSTTPPKNYTSSPLSLPRLSLLGYTEDIPTAEAEEGGLVSCYLRSHPDARWWLPGDSHAAHDGRWVRMVVRHVYWLGGFGDRAYLGWLDLGEWNTVGEADWSRVRLPGEVI